METFFYGTDLVETIITIYLITYDVFLCEYKKIYFYYILM